MPLFTDLRHACVPYVRVVASRHAHTLPCFCVYGRVRVHSSGWYDGRRCDHRRRRAEATATDDEEYAAADTVEGQQPDALFWFDEAVFEDSAALLMLGDEGKDHHLYAAASTRCLQQVESTSTFPAEESARISPRTESPSASSIDAIAERMQRVQEEAKGIVAVQHAPTTTVVLEPEQRSAPAAPVVVAVPPEHVSIELGKSPSWILSAPYYSDPHSFHTDLTNCMS